MAAVVRRSRGTIAAHWGEVYETRASTELSWFQREATMSLDLIERLHLPAGAPILDVGAGASTLVDDLLAHGHTNLTLLDITEAAFAPVRARLGTRRDLRYIVADVANWTPEMEYAVWHDRALFHFMTTDEARAAYRHSLAAAVARGDHAVIATFAPDGPERCSGLPVRRYSAEALAKELEDILRLVEVRRELHRTPKGASQPFTFGVFERR